jgi:nuclear transcription Y subunit beta
MTTEPFMSTPQGAPGAHGELAILGGQSNEAHLIGARTPFDGGEHDSDFLLREQDRLLPIANVSRIMKMAVPANAKIAKDAKETVQECVSEFISFITSEASDRCNQDKRKTINGEDIIWAMENLGFDNYVQLLKIYLLKYKEVLLPIFLLFCYDISV